MRDFLEKLGKFIFIAFIFPAVAFGIVYGVGWVITHLYLIPSYICISIVGGIWVIIVGIAVFGSEDE